MSLRIGYSAWGFLGDVKLKDGVEVSTPDGNATYSWAIVHEAQARGHRVYWMQEDRDAEAWRRHGREIFASFSQEKRTRMYIEMWKSGNKLPDLDVLLVEWRWPIEGRNFGIPREHPDYQPDLRRQTELIEHYVGLDVPIIIWDLDHKLTRLDEDRFIPAAIFETSVQPRDLMNSWGVKRTRVEPPCVVSDLLQFPTLPADPRHKLAYVGSRYERDDVITEYIKPISDAYPQEVFFWGNWLKTVDECRALWPNVMYMDRITTREFREAYGEAVACPLLAKRSYLQTGFVTPRPWEALMFGTVPVGLAPSLGIDEYVLRTARDGREMVEVVEELSRMDLDQRDRLRRENVEKISFMGANHFVDAIEKVL